MEKKDLKKRFPTLAKEMEEGAGRADLEFEAEKPKRKFSDYDPDVMDFLRRCTTDEQALEIIEYMKNREEITVKTAEELCAQLKEKGLRSFGRKRDPGFYEREE
ncbi:MAG: DUF2095 domain-containing protein [Candidatus Bathyarchaeota archaeon]|nr:DUF2095 domain-containing protein [Candidatus Bathyarchaeota archaeon]